MVNKPIKRLGAVEEGILRSLTVLVNNRRRDTIYYGTLKEQGNKGETEEVLTQLVVAE